MIIDWNKNGKIDPVDIGISLAIDSYDALDSLDLMGYSFSFVQELSPERNGNGEIRQYLPHLLYAKKQSARLHRYGMGPFCRFSISRSWAGFSGVYVICNTQKLLYIGQCIDLAKRFNAGYGTISPRNCYEGGQQTNCKINGMILREYKDGDSVYLFYYETNDYDRVERKLIGKFYPLYNERF